jgi:hypothetical protein
MVLPVTVVLVRLSLAAKGEAIASRTLAGLNRIKVANSAVMVTLRFKLLRKLSTTGLRAATRPTPRAA